ncbi:hypothetical protein GCM10010358_69010 [Streptomyces minutiscleroticus]|uniref:Uncharacterized protein n=1 Tax=Streptomyces minutiscleroticus TaxID=68238 RepID=A0A918NY58_9ACTN|nr:hypothetical protein GCM10010358_69010 [Streptomyces minutiscleroticus]
MGLGRIVYVVSAAQLVSWLTEWGVPAAPVAALPVTAIVPDAVVEGPVPELVDDVRALHHRPHHAAARAKSQPRQPYASTRPSPRPPSRPSSPRVPLVPQSGRGPRCPGGARHRTDDLDALCRVRSALPGATGGRDGSSPAHAAPDLAPRQKTRPRSRKESGTDDARSGSAQQLPHRARTTALSPSVRTVRSA